MRGWGSRGSLVGRRSDYGVSQFGGLYHILNIELVMGLILRFRKASYGAFGIHWVLAMEVWLFFILVMVLGGFGVVRLLGGEASWIIGIADIDNVFLGTIGQRRELRGYV